MSQVDISRPDSAVRKRIGRQKNSYWSPAATFEEVRIADQKRSRELYGDALEDVEFLRRCGWAINVLAGGRVLFGNQPISIETLHEKAERERRLRKPPPAPIGATRVSSA